MNYSCGFESPPVNGLESSSVHFGAFTDVRIFIFDDSLVPFAAVVRITAEISLTELTH